MDRPESEMTSHASLFQAQTGCHLYKDIGSTRPLPLPKYYCTHCKITNTYFQSASRFKKAFTYYLDSLTLSVSLCLCLFLSLSLSLSLSLYWLNYWHNLDNKRYERFYV